MAASKKKIALYTVAVLFLTVLAVGAAVFYQLSDIENIKKVAVEQLERLTGREVSISAADMSFTKGIRVQILDVRIGGFHQGEPRFFAKKLWMVIKFWPLLRQRVELKKIVVEGASIQVIRDETGAFNISLGKPGAAGASGEGLLKVLNAKFMRRVEVKGGTLRFYDYKMSSLPAPEPIVVQDIYLLLRKKLLQIPFEFKFEGSLPGKLTPALFHFSGSADTSLKNRVMADLSVEGFAEIENLEVKRFQPYLTRWIPESLKEARVSLESGFSGGLREGLQTTGKFQYVLDPETAKAADVPFPPKGTLDYSVRMNQDRFDVREVRMQTGEFEFTGRGILSAFQSEDPAITFEFSTSSIPINKTKNYLPLHILPDEYHQRVHKRFRNGNIKVESMQFSGTLSQLRNLDQPQNHKQFSAHIAMEDMDWQEPLFPFKKVTGSVQLESGISTVRIVGAVYKNQAISSIKGTIRNMIFNPVADLSIETGVDMRKFHAILLDLIGDDQESQAYLSDYSDFKGPGKFLLRLSGPLEKPEDLSINASLFLDNVSLNDKTIGPRLENVTGIIHYRQLPERIVRTRKEFLLLHYEDLSGKFGLSSFSNMEGKIILNKGVPLKSANGIFRIHAEQLPKVIADLELSAPFDSLHRKMDFTKGSAEVDFNEYGNPDQPGGMKEWGKISLVNLTLRPRDDKVQPVSGLTGGMEFGEDRLHLANIQGTYNGSRFQLEGDIGPKNKTGLHVSLILKSPDLTTASLSGLPVLGDLKFTGTAETTLKVVGTPEGFRFDHRLDLSQAGYRYGGAFDKPENFFNEFQMRGAYREGEGIRIDELEYELGGNTVTGSGRIDDLDSQRFALTLDSKNFKTYVVAPVFEVLNDNRAGIADFNITGKGDFKDIANAEFSGNVDLKDLKFSPRDNLHDFILNARVAFAGGHYDVQQGKLESDRTRLMFSAQYKQGPRPKMDLKILGRDLILDELLPESSGKEGGMVKMLHDFTLFSEGACRIAFDLDTLDYRVLNLKAVSGDIAVENRKLNIKRLDFGKPSRIKGRGVLEIQDSERTQFRGLLQAKEIPARHFFELFGDTFEGGLSGQMKTLDIRVKGQGKGWSEFGNSLVAKAAFDFRSGKIDYQRLKLGALRLFGSLKKVGEEPADNKGPTLYKQIAGRFTLSESLAQTENFIYEDATRRSSLVGKFDLKRNEIDAILGVAPLAELDKFLTKIPVVGKIITGGDEQSLVKTYFTVKGKFDDPRIRPIPFTSLTKKVTGIFQGILQTPEYILTLPAEDTN